MEEKERRKHKVVIQEAINGFIVEVGCVKPIVFTSWKDLKNELEAFYAGKETKLAKKAKDGSLWDVGSGTMMSCASDGTFTIT